MPLQNFGSVLNFAADLEAEDQAFYLAASGNPKCSEYKEMFEDFVANGKKNERLMRDTCRENVCEMILEPIIDFSRQAFLSQREAADEMSWERVLAKALELETKAENFYIEGAAKIKALPEVSRALARTATRRAARREKLEGLSR
jgi:rubrerythrin